MNKKSIAVGVYKNPTIQRYLKEGLLTTTQVNKLIVEEVMIDEATGAAGVASVKGGIRRATNPKNDPEKLKKNIAVIQQNLKKKMIKHYYLLKVSIIIIKI